MRLHLAGPGLIVARSRRVGCDYVEGCNSRGSAGDSLAKLVVLLGVDQVGGAGRRG